MFQNCFNRCFTLQPVCFHVHLFPPFDIVFDLELTSSREHSSPGPTVHSLLGGANVSLLRLNLALEVKWGRIRPQSHFSKLNAHRKIKTTHVIGSCTFAESAVLCGRRRKVIYRPYVQCSQTTSGPLSDWCHQKKNCGLAAGTEARVQASSSSICSSIPQDSSKLHMGVVLQGAHWWCTSWLSWLTRDVASLNIHTVPGCLAVGPCRMALHACSQPKPPTQPASQSSTCAQGKQKHEKGRVMDAYMHLQKLISNTSKDHQQGNSRKIA